METGLFITDASLLSRNVSDWDEQTEKAENLVVSQQ